MLEARPRKIKHIKRGTQGKTWCGLDYFQDTTLFVVDSVIVSNCKRCIENYHSDEKKAGE